jgi:phosphate transport system permease protein
MSRLADRTIVVFAWLCGAVLVAVIGAMTGYLFYKGLKTLNPALIFGSTDPLSALLLRRQVFDGLFPAMAGTLMLVLMSVGWAIPIGTAAGIYLAEYAGGKTKKVFNLLFDLLAGLPSIVIGLFGFSLTLFLNRHVSKELHPCLLLSSIALAFLVLPYIIRTTQIALENLPVHTRLTGLAMGATRLQNLVHVLLPQSLTGMVSGVLLAIGRCAEDTAVIMLTGVVASAGLPRSMLSHYEALPFYIYYISSQYADQHELATGYGAAILLLFICLFLFSLAFVIKKSLPGQVFSQC